MKSTRGFLFDFLVRFGIIPSMSIYEAGISFYDGKFLRVGDEIHVADGRNWNHEFLAMKDGITEKVKELKATAPEQADGGFVVIENGSIEVSGFSTHFGLPVTGNLERSRRTRENTVELFRAQSPGYNVVNKVIV
jgi:hypothetical protein